MMKLRFKIYFFIQYLPMGIIGPFLAVFLYQKEFTGVQIGLLLGSMPIATIILQPVWSYLSDLLNTRRKILLIACLGTATASLGLGLAETFTVAFLWALLFAAMRAPIVPISNAIALDYLEETDKPDDYSLIRLWGSLAFAASSLLFASLFLDQILTYFSWLLGGIYFLQAGLSVLLPEKRQPYAFSGFKGLQILKENPDFTIYLLASIFIGGTLGIYNNYMTLFLQSLDASSWLIGTVFSLQAVLELPLMMMVPFLLKRFSMRCIILIGAMGLPVRWLIYVFIQQPGWVIPTQIFHGLAVVSVFVVGVSFIDRHIHPKWRATGQGFYSTALGIGTGVGVFLAGSVLEWFNVRSIWIFNILLGHIGLSLLLFVFRRFNQSVQ
jgi:MFS transporter, PPP family, 3-phenylpropionic acid transporter